MKRCNYWFLTVGTLLILPLAACDVNIASEVVSYPATDRTIHVTGSGSVTGEPDIATLDVGVSVERETVAEAREAAASAMTALIASLQANDVAEKDIKTENFSIHPQYDYTDDGRVLRGYRVNNTVRAKVRDLATLSEVIDGAAAAGGDSIVINSIQFMIDDTAPLQTKARSLAVKDAEAKAQTLAKASGVRLGEPVTITESTYFEGPPIPFATAELAFDDAARSATPIAPGELAVTVTVTVVYEIE